MTAADEFLAERPELLPVRKARLRITVSRQISVADSTPGLLIRWADLAPDGVIRYQIEHLAGALYSTVWEDFLLEGDGREVHIPTEVVMHMYEMARADAALLVDGNVGEDFRNLRMLPRPLGMDRHAVLHTTVRNLLLLRLVLDEHLVRVMLVHV